MEYHQMFVSFVCHRFRHKSFQVFFIPLFTINYAVEAFF